MYNPPSLTLAPYILILVHVGTGDRHLNLFISL